MSSVLIQCRCEWCDRCYFRKTGPGRVPRFCSGACRTSKCRAEALDAQAAENPFLARTFAALKGGVTPGGSIPVDVSPGYFVREGRRAAYERRVRKDERAARASRRK